jgi:hypothetical protein
MRRLITCVASVGFCQKPGQVELCGEIDVSALAAVTDTPDFEDFADSHPHPWAA